MTTVTETRPPGEDRPPSARAVARLATTIEEHRQLCRTMRQRLEPLELGGLVPVTGEAELLTQLEDWLWRAQAELRNLGSGKGRETASHLRRLERLLTGAEWRLGVDMEQALEDKQRRQHELVRGYESETREWRERIDRLRAVVGQAVADGALVATESDTVRRLEDLVKQAERAITDRRYGDVILPLHRLQQPKPPAGQTAPTTLTDQRSVDQLLADIRSRTEEARQLARRAELLLLRGATVDERIDYTLLMRTPSTPGSHGVNVQGWTTLVAQDRTLVREIVDDVTTSVNDGRRARAATRDLLRREEAEGGGHDPTAGRDDLAARLRVAGDLMYRLFVPDSMQRLLSEHNCSFTITTNDLELPWELMHDGDDFICLGRPIARMPMGRAFPRRLRGREPGGSRLRFLLLYVDPVGNLPKARSEIESIEKALHKTWKDRIEVRTLTDGDVTGKALNAILREGTFDVIHYAGHAVFDRENPELSGLLLHQREEFFAQKIRRLLEGQPLVFLNACQSSRTANEGEEASVSYMGEPAEGLASAFVYGGALGCIGSLWPIHDDPAAGFAIEFYNRLLEGNLVGEAMRLARRATKQASPDEVTWASYVLYGDPTFRLVTASDIGAGPTA